jgi:hypothetical protein
LAASTSIKQNPDYELEVLLSLDGYEFRFASGYAVKYQARRVSASAGRPHGIKYCLTLHDPNRRRVYGIDNAQKRGGGNLIVGIDIGRASWSRTSFAGRSSCWKTFCVKLNGS